VSSVWPGRLGARTKGVVVGERAATLGADMATAKKALAAPKLPKELEPHALASIDGAELEQCRLEACVLAGQAGKNVRFDGVQVVGGSLSATKLAHVTWLDVLVERCDLSMIDWTGSKLTRVEARACRITGATLAESEFDHVRFVECQLDYASFVGARFGRVTFEACQMKEVDFSGADLTGASFLQCDLQGADLTGAKLAGADVSSSSLRQVRVGAGDVRGLVVSREQAVALAQLFGLVVRDA
jgi:uncharacterized protein YjbI with pentapeptide repeats